MTEQERELYELRKDRTIDALIDRQMADAKTIANYEIVMAKLRRKIVQLECVIRELERREREAELAKNSEPNMVIRRRCDTCFYYYLGDMCEPCFSCNRLLHSSWKQSPEGE